MPHPCLLGPRSSTWREGTGSPVEIVVYQDISSNQEAQIFQLVDSFMFAGTNPLLSGGGCLGGVVYSLQVFSVVG
jgi:hypothetical protein